MSKKNQDNSDKKKSETLLQKLNRQAQLRNFQKHSEKSYQWFRKKVRTFGGAKTRDELLQDAKQKRRTRNQPSTGKMYTYIYDAKHKNKLPYWDAFPLIFMVGPAKGGFYGINLHYLPPKSRAILFDRLLDIKNSNKLDARTKIRVSYGLLKSTSKFKLFKPCFKHYLFKQVQSKLALISADEWEAALFLPTANFQGASNSKVWSQSILKV